MSSSMKKNKKIYIAGHRGLVGLAIVRRLRQAGYENLLLKTRAELDLTDQQATAAFFTAENRSLSPVFFYMARSLILGPAGGIYP